MRQGVICMLIAALVLVAAGLVLLFWKGPRSSCPLRTRILTGIGAMAVSGRRGRRRCRAAGHDNTGDHSNGRRLRRADRADAWGQTPGAYAVVPYGRGLPSGGQLAELVRHGMVLVSGW